MSEDRFDRIDQALARLEAGQGQLQARLGAVDARVGGIDSRLDGIDSRLDGIDGRFEGIDRRIDDLDRHMHVLHEDVLERIAAVAEGFPRLEAKLDRSVEELKELINRRCDPLDAAVRHHSIEIARLKKRRG